eukprot:561756-Prymnesium_polylepis.1
MRQAVCSSTCLIREGRLPYWARVSHLVDEVLEALGHLGTLGVAQLKLVVQGRVRRLRRLLLLESLAARARAWGRVGSPGISGV